MHRQTVAAAVVGLLIGATLFARWTADAPAQQPPAVEAWEFHVVEFRLGQSEGSVAQLANLYERGWEYVGLLSTGTGEDGLVSGSVAFKRRTGDAEPVEEGAGDSAPSS